MLNIRILLMFFILFLTSKSFAEEPRKKTPTKFNIDVGIGAYNMLVSQDIYVENFFGNEAGFGIFINYDYYRPKNQPVFYRLNIFRGNEFLISLFGEPSYSPLQFRTYALQLGKSLTDTLFTDRIFNLKGTLGLGYSSGMTRSEISPNKYEHKTLHSPSVLAGVDLTFQPSRYFGITVFVQSNYNIGYHYLSYWNLGGKLTFGIIK